MEEVESVTDEFAQSGGYTAVFSFAIGIIYEGYEVYITTQVGR